MTTAQRCASPRQDIVQAWVLTQIADGQFRCGHRLPRATPLARKLGVAQQTVKSAYEHLRGEGVIASVGRGLWIVAPGADAHAVDDRRNRFDIAAFVAALDHERESRSVSWRTVAQQTGVGSSTLTRLHDAKSGSPCKAAVDTLAALADWAGLSLDAYVVRLYSDAPAAPSPTGSCGVPRRG